MSLELAFLAVCIVRSAGIRVELHVEQTHEPAWCKVNGELGVRIESVQLELYRTMLD